MLVAVEAIVEQTVNQKDCPYVKPSSKRCCMPNIVTAGILIRSDAWSAINSRNLADRVLTVKSKKYDA